MVEIDDDFRLRVLPQGKAIGGILFQGKNPAAGRQLFQAIKRGGSVFHQVVVINQIHP